MSHQSQLDFVRSLTNRFPIYFAGQKVLEVGSLDINGSIRQFFSGCEYIGVDLGEGKGVDLVAKGEELDFPDGYFKVVASCECFEHNPEWEATFRNMIRMCSGLVFYLVQLLADLNMALDGLALVTLLIVGIIIVT